MLRACSIFYEASFRFSAALFLHLPVWQGPPEPIYSHTTNLIRHTKYGHADPQQHFWPIAAFQKK